MTRKPAVLFVDDEPRILDGIRRSLRPRRDDWDLAFAADGPAALELLAQTPFDVVVSDMRMPGMDGAQLLARVSERHPCAARVVLSGHSEKEAGLRASVVGHRFLSKPCDGQTLIELLDQLTDGTCVAQDEHQRTTAGAVHCLPILPQQLDRVTRALADRDLPFPDVVEAVANSIGLAAKVLQLANSSFFCTRSRVSCLSYAVTALGVPMVQALVEAERAPWSVPAGCTSAELLDLSAQSRHAVASARLVAQLASPASAPYAHAAALLQDAGRLALLVAGRGGGVAAGGTGADGVGPPARPQDVGAHLLHLWGLPRPVVLAVTDRYAVHDPDAHGLGVSAALRAAHLLLQDTACADPHEGAHEAELGVLLRHPQLTADGVDWRLLAGRVADQTVRALA